MRIFDLALLTQLELDRLDYCVGGGRVERAQPVRLSIGPTPSTVYANAQLDDYHQDNRFRWRPPLRMTVVARFSGPGSSLTGTAGFGFWNDPAGMTGRIRLRMPQSVWFFYAGGPNWIPLILGDPGSGWRASALNTATPEAGLTLPIAPFLAAAMRLPSLKQPIWRWLQRRMRLSGHGLDATSMDDWHRYELTWQPDQIGFAIDGYTVWQANVHVSGPLGLVTWIDNQFMVATPEGYLRHGNVETPGQWLELATLTIDC